MHFHPLDAAFSSCSCSFRYPAASPPPHRSSQYVASSSSQMNDPRSTFLHPGCLHSCRQGIRPKPPTVALFSGSLSSSFALLSYSPLAGPESILRSGLSNRRQRQFREVSPSSRSSKARDRLYSCPDSLLRHTSGKHLFRVASPDIGQVQEANSSEFLCRRLFERKTKRRKIMRNRKSKLLG